MWLSLAPTRGRGQSGHRSGVVVSGQDHLDVVDTLVMIVPVTSTDRGWPNHIPITGPAGLDRPSWVMAEQLRTVSRERVTGTAGHVDGPCVHAIRDWLTIYLGLP